MIMRNTVFDYVGNLDTLLAVFIGALLATGGALIAEIIQDKRNRKRCERDAARFFGDILTSFDRVLDFTFRSQTIGDPWGPTTLRLFKTALREAQVYERNRERLFDIREMGLRNRIHTHFLTETFPLEAIIEGCEQLHEIKALLDQSKLSRQEVKRLETELEQVQAQLETGLEALKTERAKTPELCTDLERIADTKFDQALINSYASTAEATSNENAVLND